MAEPTVIPFQGTERRPIIGLRSVPPSPENGLPYPGEGWVTVTIYLFEGKLFLRRHSGAYPWQPLVLGNGGRGCAAQTFDTLRLSK